MREILFLNLAIFLYSHLILPAHSYPKNDDILFMILRARYAFTRRLGPDAE